MGIKLTAAQIIALRNVEISPKRGTVHVTAKGQTMNALRRHGIVCEEGNTLTRFGNAVRIELSDPAIIASKGHMTVVSRMLPTDLDEYTPAQPVECIHDKPMSSCFECSGDTPEFHAAHSAPEDAQDAPVSASEPEDATPARVRVSGPCEWTRTDSEGEKHECAGGMGFGRADAVHKVNGKRLCAYHSPKDTTAENLALFGYEDARPAAVWVMNTSGYWIEYAVIPNGDPHRVAHFLRLAKAIPAYKSTAHVRYLGDPTPSPVKDAPMASQTRYVHFGNDSASVECGQSQDTPYGSMCTLVLADVTCPDCLSAHAKNNPHTASQPAPALPATTPLMDSVASLNRVWIRVGKSATVHISKGRGESICGRSGGQSVKMFPEYTVCKRCAGIQEKDAERARKIAYGAMRDAELDRMTYGGAPYTKAEEERDMADYTKGYDRTTDADIAILTADGFVEATPEILAQEIGALNAEITVECSLSIKVDGIMINLGWHTFTLSESESVLRTVPALYGARNGEWRRPGNADWASVIVVDAYNVL